MNGGDRGQEQSGQSGEERGESVGGTKRPPTAKKTYVLKHPIIFDYFLRAHLFFASAPPALPPASAVAGAGGQTVLLMALPPPFLAVLHDDPAARRRREWLPPWVQGDVLFVTFSGPKSDTQMVRRGKKDGEKKGRRSRVHFFPPKSCSRCGGVKIFNWSIFRRS